MAYEEEKNPDAPLFHHLLGADLGPYQTDLKIEQPATEFTNQAQTRQINYVQETPVDIDFSQFDKLQVVLQTAQEDRLISKTDNFANIMELKRKERIRKLCAQFEDTKASAVALETAMMIDQEVDQREEQSHHTLLLKKIAGFFALQLNLVYTLPHLFPKENLKALWDLAVIALQKMLEVAMGTSELDEMIELKRSMLVFSLCM